MHKLPGLAPGIRPLTNPEADRLDASFPSTWTPEKCGTCSGSRSFRWWNHYGATEQAGLRNFDDFASVSSTEVVSVAKVVDYQCPCIDQWVLHRYLLHCGVGKDYQRLCWEDCTHVPAGAKEFAQKWMRSSDWNIRNGRGLAFHGDIGTGKTLLSVLLVKDLIAKGHDCYFTSFTDAINMFTAGWRSAEDKAWFEQRVRNASILVIDDMGREHKYREIVDGKAVHISTALAESVIDTVLRHRLANAMPTFITTNVAKADMGDRYGPNVIDLMERSDLFNFQGRSYRGDLEHERQERERELNLTRPVVIA